MKFNKQTRRGCMIGVFFGLVLSFIGCNDIDDCKIDPSFSQMKVKFLDKDSLTTIRVRFDSIKAVGSDSIFYNDNDSLDIFNFNVNPFSSQLALVFHSGLSSDSLIIQYNSANSVISAECGPTLEYSDLELLRHTFDSASVTNNFFDPNLTDNIEVYN